MDKLLLFLLLFVAGNVTAQPAKYTVANTHSHNDYEQPIPFWMAYQEQFGSIEADIWLVNGQLLVAHNRQELALGRTLESYYVRPLAGQLEKNNGHPYEDTTRKLQILIDVKADSSVTLDALVILLKKYPVITSCTSVSWVISGNRPKPELYTSYPSYIAFDGILHAQYTPEALSRISLMSDDLRYYTRWNGHDTIPVADKRKLQKDISAAHDLHLPVRLWDAPDFPEAWGRLIQLKVDLINTDHIRELAEYLRNLPSRQ